MGSIPGNIDTPHPRLDELGVSLILVGDRHEVSEGIIVERSALDTGKLSIFMANTENFQTYKSPKSMYVYTFLTKDRRAVRCDRTKVMNAYRTTFQGPYHIHLED